MPEWLSGELLTTMILAILSSAVLSSLISIYFTNRFSRKQYLRSKLEQCLVWNTQYNKMAGNSVYSYSGALAGHLNADELLEVLKIQTEGDNPESWAKLHAAGWLHFKDLRKVLMKYERIQKEVADLDHLAFDIAGGIVKRRPEHLEQAKALGRALDEISKEFVGKVEVLSEKYRP